MMYNNEEVNTQTIEEVTEEKMVVTKVLEKFTYPNSLAIINIKNDNIDVAVVNDNKVIGNYHLNIGYADIINRFPDINSDYSEIDMEEIISYIIEKLDTIYTSADIIVLAGNNYIDLYEELYYQFMDTTPFSFDKNSFIAMDAFTQDIQNRRYFYYTSLLDMKKTVPNIDWWDNSRAIIIIISAFVRTMNIKYILASNIKIN